MRVRMYVPLWISNATEQLISAAVVPVQPPAVSQNSQQQRQPRLNQGNMRDAAESMQLRVMDTHANAGSRRQERPSIHLIREHM